MKSGAKTMKIIAYNSRVDEEEFFVKFSRKYNVEILRCALSPDLENANLAKGCECVSVVTTEINAELIKKFHETGVRFISTRTVGFEHIDLDAAKKTGIQVDNITYSTSSVSEYTVMLILMTLRRAKLITERSNVQDNSLIGIRGKELRNMTVGVIGTGKIGCAVIQNLSGFGCKVIAYNRSQREDLKNFCEYVCLETLYKKSDVITVHIPATQENLHLINHDTIQQMKDGVIIINTSRGSLIDTAALIKGIEEKKIGGIALDVIEGENTFAYRDTKGEPILNREYLVLKSFPNVIITPHTAFYTDQAISDMVENSVRSCVEFIKKKSPSL